MLSFVENEVYTSQSTFHFTSNLLNKAQFNEMTHKISDLALVSGGNKQLKSHHSLDNTKPDLSMIHAVTTVGIGGGILVIYLHAYINMDENKMYY